MRVSPRLAGIFVIVVVSSGALFSPVASAQERSFQDRRPLTASMKRHVAQYSQSAGNAYVQQQPYDPAEQSRAQQNEPSRNRVEQRLHDARLDAIRAARYGVARGVEDCF